MSKFDECLAETLRWEGGFSNDPYDPGGATMKGVTTARYKAFRKSKGLPMQPVKNITDEELREIYRVYYWDYVWGDKLPNGVDLAVFDFGVNSGPSRAVRYLQKALGVRVDGHMGPVTIEALERADPVKVTRCINNSRLRFVRKIKTFWRFGKGWTRRINGIKAACNDRLGIATAGNVTDPYDEADRQSRTQGRADLPKPGLNTPTGIGVGTAIGTGVAAAPKEALKDLTVWQQVATQVKSLSMAVADHWPYFIGAIGIWAIIVYLVPYLYREFRD